MPGSPLKKAERLAVQIKNGISERVKAPGVLVVEVTAGVAEYSNYTENFANSTHEVDELIRIATEKSSI
jgi:hypothetical protein